MICDYIVITSDDVRRITFIYLVEVNSGYVVQIKLAYTYGLSTYIETDKKWVEGKMNKAFLLFLPNFYHI